MNKILISIRECLKIQYFIFRYLKVNVHHFRLIFCNVITRVDSEIHSFHIHINSPFVCYCYFNTAANHTFGSIFDVWNAYISTFYPFHLYLKIFLYVQMCIHLSDMICFEWKTPMDGKMFGIVCGSSMEASSFRIYCTSVLCINASSYT